MKILVTGSSGLIGSEAVVHYDHEGHSVIGVDNNLRRDFFGGKGDTSLNLIRLRAQTADFVHRPLDIRDRDEIFGIFQEHRFDVVIHCAAQPSHDKAGEIPLVDFDVNAVGTLNLLEATRLHAPDATFVHMSTNKVYGDAPNEIPMRELETRWDYEREEDWHGVDETCRIDRSLHSLFGASKLAADVLAQEYGRYFGMKVGIFRAGCLTGPAHAGVELHGFLSYLVHCAVTGKPYTIFGYEGKQVRDQIHSRDVITAIDAFVGAPRRGEVYNLGGGRENSASILECIRFIEDLGGYRLDYRYADEARRGDHICYISDVRKFEADYPEWRVSRSLESIIVEMIEAEEERHSQSTANQPDDG